jgi:hypothetical protein
MALMGYFEARKGPFAFFTDVVWADLGFPGHCRLNGAPLRAATHPGVSAGSCCLERWRTRCRKRRLAA